ncbi:MAG: DUF6502 family protein [Pseudomonadota bacterium]
MSGNGIETPATIFGRVIRGLLRPLVRALIAQGVTAPALYRIIKEVYVDVAEQDFSLDDGRQTDSRISMLTGVHRRDVRSFRSEDRGEAEATEEKVTTLATVIGRWLASPDTRDADGRPLPLPRSAESGPTFDSLVQSASTDIRPRTVLDELERQKLVEVREGMVYLHADPFLGPSDPDQKIHFFAENVGDHIAAAVDNLLADDSVYMERAVFYNRLTSDSIEEIEREARRLGGAALTDLNEMAHVRQTEDLDAPGGTRRFRFGVFFYTEDEGPAAKDSGTGDDEKT